MAVRYLTACEFVSRGEGRGGERARGKLAALSVTALNFTKRAGLLPSYTATQDSKFTL